MKYLIFTVFDAKAENFGMPIFFPQKAAAMRAFQDQVQQEGTLLNKHPEDFTLFEVGYFESDTAEVTKLEPKVALASGLDYINQE